MIKFASELLNSKVIAFQEGKQIGFVRKLIFDPKNGDFLGFFILGAIGLKNIVPANQIKAIGSGIIIIKELSSLSELDDVIKIKEALKINPKIAGEKVLTESGQYLGRAVDATIDTTHFNLERLYVNPSFSLTRLTKQIMIPARKIIEIKKEKIIVSDEFAQARTKFASAGLPVNK